MTVLDYCSYTGGNLEKNVFLKGNICNNIEVKSIRGRYTNGRL